jgi:regulator of sigma E protease
MGQTGGREVGSVLMATTWLVATTWLQWILQPSSWWVILQVALGLGFVIFVHELGHFLVAKACGVKCEKFFLGFDVGGLKLASLKWGETEYGIGALPLGGYVKMLGQDDNPAAAAKEAERARAALASGDLPPEPVSGPHPAWDPRSYPAQSVPERMAIISAGVIMNVIFAILMASWAYGLGVKELTCEVSGVRPGGAAWRAGLRTGDEITAIGATKDPIFSDLQKGITLGDVTKGVDFTIHRPADDSTQTLTLRPDTDLGVPTVGVTSPFSLTLPEDLREGLPGAAGRARPPLVAGDTITAVDGTPVKTYAELVALLLQRADQPVSLSVSRSSQTDGSAAETLSVELPTQAARSTGMTMSMIDVKAVQNGSPAAAAGIEPGDRLVAVDGKAVADPLVLDETLRRQAGTPVKLTLARAGVDREVEVTPRSVSWIEESRWPSSPVSVSSLGVAVGVDALVAAVEPDGPAARAGIKPGERVTRVVFVSPEEQKVGKGKNAEGGLELSTKSPSWPYVMAALQQVDAGTRLDLVVEDADGTKRDVSIEPVVAEGRFVADRGLLFEPLTRMVRSGSFLSSLKHGFWKAIDDLSLVYKFLHKLTSNQISPRLLGGPIEIAKQAGKSAEEGFSRFLLFLTMLSANLAVVNFLPIPVLDGGHMVFLLYEWLRGKPPSEGVVAALSYLGLALILTLMMFVFGLDLGLIPRR